MSFVATDPQNHQSENTWFTPKEFIEKLGPFNIDPCTVSFRPFETAMVCINHDLGFDGLRLQWLGDAWINPPYGKEIMPFIDKFIKHREGVMLIFARMDSEGVQRLLNNGAYIFLLRKRVRFINKDLKQSSNAGSGSCLVFFNKKYIDKIEKGFQGVFVKSIKSFSIFKDSETYRYGYDD